MRGRGARVAVLIVAAAAVVVLFVVLAGGDDDSSDTGTTQTQPAAGATVTTGQGQSESKPDKISPRVVVDEGKPSGGVERLSYKSGDRIQFVVKSDVADEVHVHGYDMLSQANQ